MSILIRPLVCARCEAIHFHAIQRFAERVLVVKQKTHHDGRKHQCSTPQMESMLTEAECSCAKLSMASFPAKCCGNSQNNFLADCAKTNKQQSSNTADMQQLINVHLRVHHGIQILPQGQRGTRIEQHASTSFDDKRHTATQ